MILGGGRFLGLCCCTDFSLISEIGGYAIVAGPRFLAVGASPVMEHSLYGVRASGLAAPGLWSASSVVVAHGLSCSAAWGSSQTRDRSHVSCIGRQLPYH